MGVVSVAREVRKTFDVSARTVYSDVARIYRLWQVEDSRHSERARARVRRNLERLARQAEAAGKRGEAIQALGLLARVNGMIAPPSVSVSVQALVVMDDSAAELLRENPDIAEALERAHAERAARALLPGPRGDGARALPGPLEAGAASPVRVPSAP
jgi:hypothetical protein